MGKFPERFMFQLTKEESLRLRSQIVILKRGQHTKYLPYAFTEHGILMLSSVLNSERADKISIHIIDTFIKLREVLSLQKDVFQQLEQLQIKVSKHDNQILIILDYLKQSEKLKQIAANQKNRDRIGFKKG